MELTSAQEAVITILEEHNLTAAAIRAREAFENGKVWRPTPPMPWRGFQKLLNTANCDAQSTRHMGIAHLPSRGQT